MLYLSEHGLAVAIQLNGDCGMLENRIPDHAFSLASALAKTLGDDPSTARGVATQAPQVGR